MAVVGPNILIVLGKSKWHQMGQKGQYLTKNAKYWPFLYHQLQGFTRYHQTYQISIKKSWNGDTLGPVELNVWPEQGNQGDWLEHDGQGEVSIIIFGMSKSSGFQKYSIRWVFQALFLCLCLCLCLCHCLCLCVCVLWWFLNSFHHKLSEYVWL